MKWLNSEAFNKEWVERYKPCGMGVVDTVWLNLSSDYLLSLIPFEAKSVQIDGLGDAFEWYLDTDEHLVIIRSMIDAEGMTTLLFPMSLKEDTDSWDYLQVLEIFSDNLFQAVRWIRTVSNGGYSIFYRENGIVESMFRNVTKENAESLLKYLISKGSELLMVVASDELFYEDWTGYKLESGKENIVCSYSCRSAVDSVIADYRKRNPTITYLIKPREIQEAVHWKLCRLDDNDNKFEIRKYKYEVDARLDALEYERKGHKQTYWAEPI